MGFLKTDKSILDFEKIPLAAQNGRPTSPVGLPIIEGALDALRLNRRQGYSRPQAPHTHTLVRWSTGARKPDSRRPASKSW